MLAQNRLKARGFSLVEVLVVVAVVVVGFLVARQLRSPQGSLSRDGSARGGGQKGLWVSTADGWEARGTVPQCPDPLLTFPVDLSQVTSILYPGQYRGGNYKPHGGFRFDQAKTNDVTVVAPMSGEVVRGARYLVDGEVQYTFDFIAPCGYMYRFGHLLTLVPKFAAIAEQFPLNPEGDSRDTAIEPTVSVVAGEEIATAIGVTKGSHDGGINVFVDWGMYDLRAKNDASKKAAWAQEHPYDIEQRAVCWFDLLAASDEVTVRALPSSDSGSGTTSDYCN